MPASNNPSQRIPSTCLANPNITSTKRKKAVTPPAKIKTPLDRMIDRAQVQHLACRRVFHLIAREDTDGSSHESP